MARALLAVKKVKAEPATGGQGGGRGEAGEAASGRGPHGVGDGPARGGPRADATCIPPPTQLPPRVAGHVAEPA